MCWYYGLLPLLISGVAAVVAACFVRQWQNRWEECLTNSPDRRSAHYEHGMQDSSQPPCMTRGISPPTWGRCLRRMFVENPVSWTDEIETVPYAHGGYFAAAPFLLQDPKWIAILEFCMPTVLDDLIASMLSPSGKLGELLIQWAENNPVVAAFGVARELNTLGQSTSSSSLGGRRITTLEWDVFLDPSLARQLQRCMENREPTAAIDALSQRLVASMLVGHGNLMHLAIEQLGIAKRFNHTHLQYTAATQGGGIPAHRWMEIFSTALSMGLSDSCLGTAPIASSEPRTDSRDEQTLAQSVYLVEKITEMELPIGLVLDIKSRHVPHCVWGAVVDTLRTAGIRVEGIGSFACHEIRDMSRYTKSPVRELVLVHSAGDVQQGCHQGKIRRGDTIFFNGGSLVTRRQSEAPDRPGWNLVSDWLQPFDPVSVQSSYCVEACGVCKGRRGDSKHSAELSCLQDYKIAYDLSIGMYCQEFAIDEVALQLLVQVVNDNAAIYDLGFAWGGINGLTIQGIAPTRSLETTGYWRQKHVGSSWDYCKHPPIHQ